MRDPSTVTALNETVLPLVMPLTATELEQSLGMDDTQHGEDAYATGEGAILITQESDLEPPVPVAQPG